MTDEAMFHGLRINKIPKISLRHPKSQSPYRIHNSHFPGALETTNLAFNVIALVTPLIFTFFERGGSVRSTSRDKQKISIKCMNTNRKP